MSEYDEREWIEWEWQSMDGAMTIASFAKGAIGPNPTDRAKRGVKRSLLTDGAGIPLLSTHNVSTKSSNLQVAAKFALVSNVPLRVGVLLLVLVLVLDVGEVVH